MLNLPILEKKQEIIEAVRNNQVSVLVGETGSGKTTLIPLFLWEEGFGNGKLIGVTQPRRVAATSVARFVAGQIGCEVSEEVGYKIRFDDETTEGTMVKFMTDGILLREVTTDPNLSKYGVIVVDEAHERSLNIDFVLGLLKELIVRRPDLKVLITSATIDAEKFASYFGGAPIVEVSGRQHPVDIEYVDYGNDKYVESAAEEVAKIHKSGKPGDILVFMTGQDDIKMTCEKIAEKGLVGLTVLPLYGDMSPEDQEKIFRSCPGRKVVVATNIAETSITIDGIVFVVDSGKIKQTGYNSKTGIGSLSVTPHSRAGCDQRAGRAGRTQPGQCIRLFSEEDYASRPEYTKPEILRTDLAGIVLQMKSLGIENIEGFEFVDQPDKQAFHDAHETLINLGALDKENGLTEIGKTMARLPLEPRLARMIVEAKKRGCVSEVTTIAAGLSGRSVFVRPKDKEREADNAHIQFENSSSDFQTFLNVWNAYVASGKSWEWAKSNFLHTKALDEVSQIRQQLFEVLHRSGIANSSGGSKEEIAKSVTAGLVENLCEKYGRFDYINSGIGGINIHPSSSLFAYLPKWLVCGAIVETKNSKGIPKTYARSCQQINPEWPLEVAPQLCSKKFEEGSITYDKLEDKVMGMEIVTFNGHELLRRYVEVTGEQAREELAWGEFKDSHLPMPVSVKACEELPHLPEPLVFCEETGAKGYPALYRSWSGGFEIKWFRNLQEASYSQGEAQRAKARMDAEELERQGLGALREEARNLYYEVSDLWQQIDPNHPEEYGLKEADVFGLGPYTISARLSHAKYLMGRNSLLLPTEGIKEAIETFVALKAKLEKALEFYGSYETGTADDVTDEQLQALQERFGKKY